MPSIWRKSGGSWQKIKTVYRKTGGSWQSVKRIWRKTGGAWQLVFQQSITPSIQSPVELTQANTTTQTVRLTGKLYHWLNATSVTYNFAKSTNGTSYSNISGASGTSTNPASGGSNTNDQYVVAQADVTANTTNYYIYISKASNSTFGTEQTSTSNSVTIEAPRNLSLSNSKTSTSITIAWTNDTYSGRYEYQWKLSTSSTWSTSVFIAPGIATTSFTITGLSSSTNYDFRVRGWTGTSNNYGYYGEYATATVATNAPQPPNAPGGLYADSVNKEGFFLGWNESVVDSTHDAATSYDYGVNTSNTTAPATLITGTSGSNLNPSNNQYKNILLADTDRYELIDELSPGTDYYGWVRAKNDGGSSSWSVSSKITTTPLKPPNPVTNLAHDSANRTQTSLKFTWTAPTTDSTHDAATKYIYHTSDTNSEPTEANYNGYIDGGSTTSVTVSSLTANTTYYFWIKAGNNDGYSASRTTNGTTQAASNPPGAPTLTVSNPSPSGIGLSWTAGTGGTPTKYEVAVSTSTTPPTTTSITTEIDNWYDVGTSTSMRTTGLSASTTYYAWVRASNADGTSPNSNRGNTTTLAAPTVTNPSWTSSNFQRTNYAQYTIGRSRPTTTTRRAFPDNSGTSVTDPGNISTEYSTTSGRNSVTIAALGTAYNGTQTITTIGSTGNGDYIQWTGTSTTTEAFTSDTDGTITASSRFRYGWNNGTITKSGTGTYSNVNPAGFDYEIYSVATGGTAIDSGLYTNSVTDVTRQVNSVNYDYTYFSGRNNLGNSVNPRYMRIKMLAIDYDNKVWEASWTGRV